MTKKKVTIKPKSKALNKEFIVSSFCVHEGCERKSTCGDYCYTHCKCNKNSNLLLPTLFSCLNDALNALAEAEYDCKSSYGRRVNLIYDWGNDSWWVKLKGLRDDLGSCQTPLQACQEMYNYLVVLGVKKYSGKRKTII